MQTDFDTTQYEFSHGKRPSGAGTWIFQDRSTGEQYVAPYGVYTTAKRYANRWAAERGISRLTVCP